MFGKVDEKTIPPLWGSNSFNDGAGMNTLEMLAPFIYLNMPYQQANLTRIRLWILPLLLFNSPAHILTTRAILRNSW